MNFNCNLHNIFLIQKIIKSRVINFFGFRRKAAKSSWLKSTVFVCQLLNILNLFIFKNTCLKKLLKFLWECFLVFWRRRGCFGSGSWGVIDFRICWGCSEAFEECEVIRYRTGTKIWSGGIKVVEISKIAVRTPQFMGRGAESMRAHNRVDDGLLFRVPRSRGNDQTHFGKRDGFDSGGGNYDGAIIDGR